MNITEMIDKYQRLANKNIHNYLRGEMEYILSSLQKLRLSIAEAGPKDLSLIVEIEKAETILDKVYTKLGK